VASNSYNGYTFVAFKMRRVGILEMWPKEMKEEYMIEKFTVAI
jgi:hypothetical protein